LPDYFYTTALPELPPGVTVVPRQRPDGTWAYLLTDIFNALEEAKNQGKGENGSWTLRDGKLFAVIPLSERGKVLIQQGLSESGKSRKGIQDWIDVAERIARRTDGKVIVTEHGIYWEDSWGSTLKPIPLNLPPILDNIIRNGADPNPIPAGMGDFGDHFIRDGTEGGIYLSPDLVPIARDHIEDLARAIGGGRELILVSNYDRSDPRRTPSDGSAWLRSGSLTGRTSEPEHLDFLAQAWIDPVHGWRADPPAPEYQRVYSLPDGVTMMRPDGKDAQGRDFWTVSRILRMMSGERVEFHTPEGGLVIFPAEHGSVTESDIERAFELAQLGGQVTVTTEGVHHDLPNVVFPIQSGTNILPSEQVARILQAKQGMPVEFQVEGGGRIRFIPSGRQREHGASTTEILTAIALAKRNLNVQVMGSTLALYMEDQNTGRTTAEPIESNMLYNITQSSEESQIRQSIDWAVRSRAAIYVMNGAGFVTAETFTRLLNEYNEKARSDGKTASDHVRILFLYGRDVSDSMVAVDVPKWR
jgi:hypothetical protein